MAKVVEERDYKQFIIPLSCHDCYLTIDVYKFNEEKGYPPEIYVNNVGESSYVYYRHSWKNRIARVWRELRGKDNWPAFEFYNEKDFNNFMNDMTDVYFFAYGERKADVKEEV